MVLSKFGGLRNKNETESRVSECDSIEEVDQASLCGVDAGKGDRSDFNPGYREQGGC